MSQRSATATPRTARAVVESASVPARSHDGPASASPSSQRARRSPIGPGAHARGSEDAENLEELERAWVRYWTTHHREDRNVLVMAHLPLVRAVVMRLPGTVRSNWDLADLESFGLLGLIEAIDHFSAGSETFRFPAYARQRIRGAVFDELRHLDWLPRTVRRRTTAFRQTADLLALDLGRNPEPAEVAQAMGVEQRHVPGLLREVQSAQLMHFRRESDSEDRPSSAPMLDRITAPVATEPGTALLAAEQLGELDGALAQLPLRHRQVIQLRFFEGLTQAEAGRKLGVSNSRVCQIETAALARMRKQMDREPVRIGA